MSIKYEVGDMFKSNCDCLINAVNCEGYMGKGLAYQFKLKYPETNKDYVKSCKSGKLHIGTLHYFKEDNVVIINFPTKDKWRNPSLLSYIELGLDALVSILPSLNVKTIAIPPLGCGNGGLNWIEVRTLIQNKLEEIKNDYNFIIFEPSKYYNQKAKVAPSLTISSLVLMHMKTGLKDFSKLRLQKTAYFMNIFLKEEYFKFQKYKYGPYAYSIDILSKNIKEYQDFYEINDINVIYDMVYKTLCSEKTDKLLKKLNPSINKAVDYVNKIEKNEDLEGITSVLYLIETGIDNTEAKLVENFQLWSEDKAKRFSKERIIGFIEYLNRTLIIEKDLFENYHISNYL